MTSAKTIGELRAAAREGLLGRYGTAITAFIIFMFIELGASGLLRALIPTGSVTLVVLSFVAAFIVELLMGVLVSGLAYLYLNIIYAQPVSVSDVFFGFKEHPEKAVAIQAVFSAADILPLIPAQILVSRGLLAGANIPQAPMLITLTAAGAVIALIVHLTYSQSFYLLHDYPDRSAMELLQASRGMMRGERLKLLTVYLSFIPMALLGIITLFLPLLWVRAYLETTLAAFYKELVSKRHERSVAL